MKYVTSFSYRGNLIQIWRTKQGYRLWCVDMGEYLPHSISDHFFHAEDVAKWLEENGYKIKHLVKCTAFEGAVTTTV